MKLETPEEMAERIGREHRGECQEVKLVAAIRADREAIRRVLIAEAVSWPHANGRAALTHASCLLLGKEPR